MAAVAYKIQTVHGYKVSVWITEKLTAVRFSPMRSDRDPGVARRQDREQKCGAPSKILMVNSFPAFFTTERLWRRRLNKVLTENRWDIEMEVMDENFSHLELEPFKNGDRIGFQGWIRLAGQRSHQLVVEGSMSRYPQEEPRVYLYPRPED